MSNLILILTWLSMAVIIAWCLCWPETLGLTWRRHNKKQKTEEIELPQPFIKFGKGTQIVCPKCGVVQGTAKRDIYNTEFVSSAAWEGILQCSAMACHDCGTWYRRWSGGSGVSLHTNKGWV